MNDITNNIIYSLEYLLIMYSYSLIISLFYNIMFRTTFRHKNVLLFFGFIGTIIHEACHLILAVIFRHKVIKVKFFDYSDKYMNGFVETKYNPKSYYQRTGVFFISIAPTLVISLFLK